MLTPRLTLPVLVGLAFAFAACQDPSGVGLTLIGDETSDPNTTSLQPTSVSLLDRDEVTGGFASTGGEPEQENILIGAFEDDVLGNVRARAYIDVRSSSLPSGFDERALEEVQIRLVRDMSIGDTLASLPLEVREITSNWNPEGLPSDTTITTGELITSTTVSAQDSLVTIDLTDEFIAANTGTLRDSVNTRFEGFEVSIPDAVLPNVVGAYDASASRLRLIGEEYEDDGEMTRDTVFFPIAEVFTSIIRTVPDASDERQTILDGSSRVIRLEYDFEDFANAPLANVTLRVPFDRTVLERGDGFFRPLVGEVALIATLDDGTSRVLTEQLLPEEGDILTIRGPDLTTLVQAQLLGRIEITGLEIIPRPTPLGLGALPVIVEDDGAGTTTRPTLSLLTVGAPA